MYFLNHSLTHLDYLRAILSFHIEQHVITCSAKNKEYINLCNFFVCSKAGAGFDTKSTAMYHDKSSLKTRSLPILVQIAKVKYLVKILKHLPTFTYMKYLIQVMHLYLLVKRGTDRRVCKTLGTCAMTGITVIYYVSLYQTLQ